MLKVIYWMLKDREPFHVVKRNPGHRACGSTADRSMPAEIPHELREDTVIRR